MAFKAQLTSESDSYLREKKVPELIEHLFHELAVAMPEDPLQFLSSILSKSPKPRVTILGDVVTGKSTLAENLANKYQIPVINLRQILSQDSEAADELAKASAGTTTTTAASSDSPTATTSTSSSAAAAAASSPSSRTDAITAKIVAKYANKAAKENGGWILDGFPRTRSEAVGLQAAGVLPGVVFHLGNVDSMTKQDRMQNNNNNNNADVVDAASLMGRARMYQLNHDELLKCYPSGTIRFEIDASVSTEDVVAQAEPRVAAILS